MEENRKKRLKTIAMVILGLVAIIILILIFLPRTTIQISNTEQDEIIYLTCNKAGLSKDHPLLSDMDIEDVGYEVKIKFVNDSTSEFSLMISKEYSNIYAAEDFVNRLQANFNIYVGERNISKEGLNPTYTFVDNVGKMVLSIKGDYLAYDNVPLLMLGNDIVNKKELSDYEIFLSKRGFTCNTK